jgi:hypothetical protein
MASPTVSLSSIALITLAEYLAYVGILDSADTLSDQRADQMISGINYSSQWAETYCNRPFVEASDMDNPTDEYDDEITEYQAYADAAAVPEDVKMAVKLLTQYAVLMADHAGIAASSTGADRSKTYRITFPKQAIRILNRYKYWPYQQEEYVQADFGAGFFA